MLKKVVLISGGAAVGKTAVLKNIIPLLQSKDLALSVCKIDCVATRDGSVYQNMGIPYVVGISGDLCPDHFLVSNAVFHSLPRTFTAKHRINHCSDMVSERKYISVFSSIYLVFDMCVLP